MNVNGTHASPFHQRFALNLLSIGLIAVAIYLGRAILVPLFFAILLAVLLLPISTFLQRRGFPKFLAILIPLLTALVFIGSIVYFLSQQIGIFLNDIPGLRERFNELLTMFHSWVQETLNITIWEQKQYISETAEQMKNNGPLLVTRTFLTLTEIISYLIFLPIYTFLLIYHKEMIKKFLVTVFTRRQQDKVLDVLHESQAVAQQYVTGLVIELMIVFTLNATGFLIFGIKYPFFLGLVAAFLNIVPYIGMLIANIFCILITLISSENINDVFYVAGVLSGVQLIDNNFLMPYIVGSKVRINALAIILGFLTGGALAGIPGMFLAVPGLAFMKVLFERVDTLKPWAIILGDETTIEEEKKNPIRKAISRVRKKKTESKMGS